MLHSGYFADLLNFLVKDSPVTSTLVPFLPLSQPSQVRPWSPCKHRNTSGKFCLLYCCKRRHKVIDTRFQLPIYSLFLVYFDVKFIICDSLYFRCLLKDNTIPSLIHETLPVGFMNSIPLLSHKKFDSARKYACE